MAQGESCATNKASATIFWKLSDLLSTRGGDRLGKTDHTNCTLTAYQVTHTKMPVFGPCLYDRGARPSSIRRASASIRLTGATDAAASVMYAVVLLLLTLLLP
jgi:hypothetical protein